jgi:hypothetical protein
MLYMFQAISPPIIRSSELYTQHRVLAMLDCYLSYCCTRKPVPTLPRQRQVAGKPGKYPMLCIQFWVSDDGRRNRLKHIENFTEINTLCNVASYWLYLKIHLQCTDPWMSKVHNKSCLALNFSWLASSNVIWRLAIFMLTSGWPERANDF